MHKILFYDFYISKIQLLMQDFNKHFKFTFLKNKDAYSKKYFLHLYRKSRYPEY